TQNKTLSLLDLIKTGLPRAELAVLSACQSAACDQSTPDEMIHIAAATLFAEFRGVVGTMWAIVDEDGPIIARRFYKYMFRNGPEAVDCRDSADGLAMAIRVLWRRNVPLDRWVNFVHFGIECIQDLRTWFIWKLHVSQLAVYKIEERLIRFPALEHMA
ncbi:hypothetical protein FRB98_009277, partial [Tulasnella sp. 332]